MSNKPAAVNVNPEHADWCMRRYDNQATCCGCTLCVAHGLLGEARRAVESTGRLLAKRPK